MSYGRKYQRNADIQGPITGLLIIVAFLLAIFGRFL
jgi:predicted nucleic acid-binding Zn ribbon protein